jgi:hypothetical protein
MRQQAITAAYLLCGATQLVLILRIAQTRQLRAFAWLAAFLAAEVLQALVWIASSGFRGIGEDLFAVGRLLSALLAVIWTLDLVVRVMGSFSNLRAFSAQFLRFGLPIIGCAAGATLLLDLVIRPHNPLAAVASVERALHALSLLGIFLLAAVAALFHLDLSPNARTAVRCWFAVLWTLQLNVVAWWISGGGAPWLQAAALFGAAAAYFWWAWAFVREGVPTSNPPVPLSSSLSNPLSNPEDILQQLRSAQQKVSGIDPGKITQG